MSKPAYHHTDVADESSKVDRNDVRIKTISDAAIAEMCRDAPVPSSQFLEAGAVDPHRARDLRQPVLTEMPIAGCCVTPTNSAAIMSWLRAGLVEMATKTPETPQLQCKDTTNELWREYRYEDAQGKPRTYRIARPRRMYYYRGCTTHRVLDADGLVHVVPAVSQGGCVMVYQPIDVNDPCRG